MVGLFWPHLPFFSKYIFYHFETNNYDNCRIELPYKWDPLDTVTHLYHDDLMVRTGKVMLWEENRIEWHVYECRDPVVISFLMAGIRVLPSWGLQWVITRHPCPPAIRLSSEGSHAKTYKKYSVSLVQYACDIMRSYCKYFC